MNKGIVKLISILAVMAVVSGCSSLAPNAGGTDADRPILSAAEAQAEIKVTVRTLAPAVEQDTLVAAVD